MTEQHHAAAIVPAHEIGTGEAFYRRPGFEGVSAPGGRLVRVGCVRG